MGAVVGGVVTDWDSFGLGLFLWVFFGAASGIGALLIGSAVRLLETSHGGRRVLTSAGAAIGACGSCALAVQPISLVHPWPIAMPVVMAVVLGASNFVWYRSIWVGRGPASQHVAP
ncbi:MAG: hypothetical protein FWF90_03450 [Promicromonosporaceae bacterium]|nr:hypothetical protein [Promicromonosporaceae bacterium]